MLDKDSVIDTINKFKAYHAIITVDKDLFYFTGGDFINSDKIFHHCLYLDLYISVLEYSLEWFDIDNYLLETSPITEVELNTLISRGNELIKSIVRLPLNN